MELTCKIEKRDGVKILRNERTKKLIEKTSTTREANALILAKSAN